MLYVDFFVEEEVGAFAELGGGFGGEVLAGAGTGEPLCHLRMAVQIVVKACSDVLALGDEFYSR